MIAIIAILAGMLLPALSKTKEVIKQTSCKNQIRQHGLLSQMYGNDFDFYPNRKTELKGFARPMLSAL